MDNQDNGVQERLSQIKHKIMVLSGKGGVGKSSVAVNLAISLAMQGRRVGLVDVDIHGPSIPTMLNLKHGAISVDGENLIPLEFGAVKVMSIGFLLKSPDDPIIWRGPMKMNAIRQFLKDVEWGELDYLIIDAPPGTGDEPLSVCELIGNLDGAIVVTTPQNVAFADVRKSLNFCNQLSLPVLGLVENMSGFTCPKCGETTDIFSAGGGASLAEEFGVPFLGRIPLDPNIRIAGDEGTPFVHAQGKSEAAMAFTAMVEIIMEKAEAPVSADKETSDGNNGKGKNMRIAIPLAEGKLSMHFGHCQTFALVDVETGDTPILSIKEVEPPAHEPGVLPKWLGDQGVSVIIAGGMGQHALSLFKEQGIEVAVGAPADSPHELVNAYLTDTLKSGTNACDH